MNKGKIVQVVGAVVDVEFEGKVPGIHAALTVEFQVANQPVKLTLEVQQQLGDRCVRPRPRRPKHRHGAWQCC